MLAVEGIYRDNQLILNKKVSFSEPVRVVVTFLDEPQNDSQKIDLAQFSFGQSRAILKESAILNMKKLSTFKWFRMRVKTLQHKLHQRIPTIKIQITG